MATNDGGTAFPVPHALFERDGATNIESHGGMSLRDYFAAQFMAARLANPTTRTDITDEELALNAYTRADAMLAARVQGGG